MELTDELFERLPLEHGDINEMVRPSISYWQDVWRRLKQNKYAVGGLAFVIFITLIAILAPVLTPYDYYSQDLSNANATPSSLHWFGLDQFGRDLLTRVIYGARISMTVGYVTSVFTLVIGIFYGGIAGFPVAG
jgi:oligopeptide transport system permease protein